MAMRTQGTLIQHLKTAPSTYEAIGSVISFDGPGGKASIIDTTDLTSTAKQKLPGLMDEGSFDMTLNYDSKDLGQQALAAARSAQLLKTFKVTFTDGATAVFTGYVMQLKLTGKADSKVESDISIEITGAVTYTPGTFMAAAEAPADDANGNGKKKAA